MSTPKPLSVILDEIEEDNASTRRGYPNLSACLDEHLQSELRLVKALRLSIAQLSSMKVTSSFDIKCDPYELENQAVTGTLSAITAILNQK